MRTIKTTLLLTLSIFFTLHLSAQNRTVESRTVASFTGVSSSSGIDVIYTKANEHTLKVEAEASIVSKIETTVVNGILTIGYAKNSGNTHSRERTNVYISAPILNSIKLTSGSDFDSNEVVSDKMLTLDLSSGSDVEIAVVNATNFTLNASSGSDTDIALLTTGSCNLNISGGSDVDMGLNVSSVNANVSGGSEVDLTGTTKTVIVNCSGASEVDVRKLQYNSITPTTSGGAQIKK